MRKKLKRIRAVSVIAAAIALPTALVLTVASSASADPIVDETTLVSAHTDGTQGNQLSYYPAISADGRYITYFSVADNLVPGDTNGLGDVFLTDTTTGTTTLISRHTDGTQGNGESYSPAISADGRYITYYSVADNLVTGDTNSTYDVFLTDTTTGTTTLISRHTDGTQGNGQSSEPVISADGRYITYYSVADNLVTGDTNSVDDVFLTDTTTGTTTLISRHTDGTQGNGESYSPAISADGRYITYHSFADNLVTGDTSGLGDVFLTDTTTGTTTLISRHTDGTQGNGLSSLPVISADGRYIAYISAADNLVPGDTNSVDDVFLTDTTTGTTTLISRHTDGTQGNGQSTEPAISADGRYIAYVSGADNLVPGDTNSTDDIFLTLMTLDEVTEGGGGSGGAELPATGLDTTATVATAAIASALIVAGTAVVLLRRRRTAE